MPVSMETRTELDLTIFTVSGMITVDEQKQKLKAFYEGSPTRNVIWDFSLMEEVSASAEDLRDIILYAKQFAGKRPGGRTALIVNTKLKYGLARMASSFAEIEEIPWTIMAFEQPDEALSWIAQGTESETPS